MKTNKELLLKNCDYELWGSKYVFESWVAVCDMEDVRTNKIYKKGDLIFTLISYIDDNGKLQYINELQYIKPKED